MFVDDGSMTIFVVPLFKKKKRFRVNTKFSSFKWRYFLFLLTIYVSNFPRIWEIPQNTLVVDRIFPKIAAVKYTPSHMLLLQCDINNPPLRGGICVPAP